LEAMKGKPVTLRTLDLGGDKMPGPRRHEREPNPALGLRAIRYCLHDRELFRIQLRALLRASPHGQLRVMFPLISTVAELREARAELENCRSELARRGVALGPKFPLGIMVETPSAVWLSDHLAREVDFFSVGTNDLIQYSLAIDRQNRDVAYLYQPLHLAVLRSMEHAIASAKAAGIPVAICGEMAADPTYALVLLALGFDEFSMTAGQISAVKQIIRQSSRVEAVGLYQRACELVLVKEIDNFIRAEMTRRFGDQFAEPIAP
jgi:phosphoenolpyruvate-protein phosphotransferase (PTS system enzyme I)